MSRETGLAEGRERGLAEGSRKNALEAARNLLMMNLGTHEQIAKAQGLSVEEVERIAGELGIINCEL